MAALFDTTVGVLLLRRNPRDDARELLRAARAEIEAGSAVLAAPVVSELIVGEKSGERAAALAGKLAQLPTAILPAEAAQWAGSMGAFLSGRGASIPFPDLLIAATAVWLDISLLAWDADYPRSQKIAVDSQSAHVGAELWRRLELHPASLRA